MTNTIRRRKCGTSDSKGEYGYSLAEALVVLAIIGIISLVSVPNFMQFMRAGKIKSAVRQFSSDLRGVRQLAVARNVRTKLSFDIVNTDPNLPPGRRWTYRIYQQRPNGTWLPVTMDARGVQTNPTRDLEESVWFVDSDFADIPGDVDDITDDAAADRDIVFFPNGTVANSSGNNSVLLRTHYDVPAYQYTITISPAGAIRAIPN